MASTRSSVLRARAARAVAVACLVGAALLSPLGAVHAAAAECSKGNASSCTDPSVGQDRGDRLRGDQGKRPKPPREDPKPPSPVEELPGATPVGSATEPAPAPVPPTATPAGQDPSAGEATPDPGDAPSGATVPGDSASVSTTPPPAASVDQGTTPISDPAADVSVPYSRSAPVGAVADDSGGQQSDLSVSSAHSSVSLATTGSAQTLPRPIISVAVSALGSHLIHLASDAENSPALKSDLASAIKPEVVIALVVAGLGVLALAVWLVREARERRRRIP